MKTTAPKRPAKPAAKESVLALPLGEILDLYNIGIGNLKLGHAGLNGFNKATGNELRLVPYSFTDDTRGNITKNRFILRPYFEEIDRDLRQSIVSDLMDDPEASFIPRDDEFRNAEFARRYQDAMDKPYTVSGLHIFERSELFRENRNPIPTETETALLPIIKGSPWRLKNCPEESNPKTEPPGGGEGGDAET